MGFRSLVSFGILAIPVAVTIALLVSIDAYRQSKGLQSVFVDNGITNGTYCQIAYGISPSSVGQQYTLNPNQWGWNAGDGGALCMNVTSFHNGTYATNATAPPFSVTWQYPQGPQTQPVHAFPNILFDGTVKNTLPVVIDSISSINIDLKWSYGVGDTAAAETDTSALTTAELNANVAIDMFLDSDPNNAQSTEKAKFEVMVWLGMFGPATQPIGYDQPVVTTQTIAGATFSLYYGQNSLGQNVLTWLASSLQEEFSGDISPLITSLAQLTSIDGPNASDNLGYLGLGSEALWSASNVTFAVPRLAMTIDKQ